MADGVYRIGIVGAASLAGKELAEELGSSVLAAADVVLLDDEEAAGVMTAAGDEIGVIQRLEADSFHRMDFVFFAGDRAVTAASWENARRAGASVVDLTDALAREPEVLVLAPWVEEALAGKTAGALGRKAPDLGTPAVVAAHPAAVMLALVAARLRASQVTLLAATVLEPASAQGRAGMDELHQQTVKLLSFQPLPKEVYDTQVAFNLLPALGEAAKLPLAGTERRIAAQYELLSAGRLPELTLQLVQAPVFHGYAASVLVELGTPATVEAVELALAGAHVEMMSEETDPPSNLSAAGQAAILARVTAGDAAGRRFWVWLAADNLKLAALNGIACAVELRRLRPQGTVQ